MISQQNFLLQSFFFHSDSLNIPSYHHLETNPPSDNDKNSHLLFRYNSDYHRLNSKNQKAYYPRLLHKNLERNDASFKLISIKQFDLTVEPFFRCSKSNTLCFDSQMLHKSCKIPQDLSYPRTLAAISLPLKKSNIFYKDSQETESFLNRLLETVRKLIAGLDLFAQIVIANY